MAKSDKSTTFNVACTPAGGFLPLQSIWGGKTPESLPATTALRRDEADRLGFTYGHGDTRHWSSLKTTKEWVTHVFDPYIARVCKDLGLIPLLLSVICCSTAVYFGASKGGELGFIPWMKATHPNVIIGFTPANLTGVFQPCDVGVQRVFKHKMKQSALRDGVPPEAINLPNDLPTLRNASVAWSVDAYNFFQQNPQLVRKAWANSKVGDWNLSWECLTSKAARDFLWERVASDPKSAEQFKDDNIPTPSEFEPAEPDAEHDDDTELSVEQLADCVLNSSDVTGVAKDSETGDLYLSTGAEDFEDVEETVFPGFRDDDAEEGFGDVSDVGEDLQDAAEPDARLDGMPDNHIRGMDLDSTHITSPSSTHHFLSASPLPSPPSSSPSATIESSTSAPASSVPTLLPQSPAKPASYPILLDVSMSGGVHPAALLSDAALKKTDKGSAKPSKAVKGGKASKTKQIAGDDVDVAKESAPQVIRPRKRAADGMDEDFRISKKVRVEAPSSTQAQHEGGEAGHEEGRGRRAKVPNTLYNAFEAH